MPLDLFAIYAAGLLTFVTPCVLPLVPIYLAALIGTRLDEATGARGRLMARAGLFALGFIGVFTALGLAASSLGGLLSANRPTVQVFGAVLILLFGLKFLGILRLPFLDRIVRIDERKLATRAGSVNAVVMGVVFAAGWSPCVGPVLGSVLSYTASATASPLRGAAYLGLYGLGLATPLLVTAAFADAGARWLKRLNPHLPRLERAVGLLLVGMALWTGGTGVRALWHARADGSALAAAVLARGPDGQPRPVVVELYAKGCAACRAMQPLVDKLKSECTARRVEVRQIELTSPLGRALARRHGVVGVPTFLLLDHEGHETGRLIGVQSEETFKQAVMAMLGRDCPYDPAEALPDLGPAPAPCGVATGAPGGAHPGSPAGAPGGTCEQAPL